MKHRISDIGSKLIDAVFLAAIILYPINSHMTGASLALYFSIIVFIDTVVFQPLFT